MGNAFDEDWLRDHRERVARQRATEPVAPPRVINRDAEETAPLRLVTARQNRARQHPEEDLQKAVAAYLDRCLPHDFRWLHVPNQRGTRKRWEMGLLNAMGVKKGVPDVLVLTALGGFIGIELKAKHGGLDHGQRQWRDWFRSIGAPWFLCRSLEDVEAAMEDAGVQMRGRLT